ncbi:MAG: S49 family peptidase [Candidatus Babeliales bacterium]|nr:S49 family peptidase [Candidatus Babeliales bacterium]
MIKHFRLAFLFLFMQLAHGDTQVNLGPKIGVLVINDKDAPNSWAYLAHLTEFFLDKEVKAIVILLEVGNGYFGYSQAFAIAKSIKDLKKIYKKPVIAYGEQWLAHSAYVVACASDCIMAAPMCMLGHMTYGNNYIDKSEQLIKEGIRITPVHAGKYKYQDDPDFKISDEDLKRAQISVNEAWQNVISNIIDLRPALKECKSSWVNGEIFIASQIKNNNFYDKIGDKLDLQNVTLQLINKQNKKKFKLSDLEVVVKEPFLELEKLEVSKDNKKTIAVVNASQMLKWEDSNYYFQLFADLFYDTNILGIVININVYGANSGSGMYNLYTQIKKLKQITKKPVVAYIDCYAYSGGYWLACCADYIIASPLADLGSVGYRWSRVDYTKYDVKNNISYNPIASNELGNIFNEHKTLTEKEQKIIQDLINFRHLGFIAQIKDSRPKLKNNESEWKEAQVYNPYKALNLGMIDKIGSSIDSVKYISKKEDLNNIKIIFRTLNKPEEKRN